MAGSPAPSVRRCAQLSRSVSSATARRAARAATRSASSASGRLRRPTGIDQHADRAAAGEAHGKGGLVADAVGQQARHAIGQRLERLGHHRALDAAARDRAHRSRPSPEITSWLPTGRGAEPQVSTTVASAAPRPARCQSSAISGILSCSARSIAALPVLHGRLWRWTHGGTSGRRSKDQPRSSAIRRSLSPVSRAAPSASAKASSEAME